MRSRLENTLLKEKPVLFSFGENILNNMQQHALKIDVSKKHYYEYQNYLNYILSHFKNQKYFYEIAEKMFLSNINPSYLKTIN